MAARPTVTVYGATNAQATGSVPLPAVLTAPIRTDVVHFVHTKCVGRPLRAPARPPGRAPSLVGCPPRARVLAGAATPVAAPTPPLGAPSSPSLLPPPLPPPRSIAKNARQAYAVNRWSGMSHSAESWGTGRAVSRIPRVSGGGTHRSGQAAFGNMCRKGRMFAPTKVWRRWHRKVNVNQRRYALVSALAASAVPALVQARGHKIDDVPELPLVVSGLEALTKTSAALKVLEALGAAADVQRVSDSKALRSGKGKMRSRRYTVRRGPLVVHAGATDAERAFRNLPGVDTVHVDRLNLLQLAPGGHLGRFVVWTQAAFEKLAPLYGSVTAAATLKAGYTLPRSAMANADLGRLINSTEVQSVVRPAVKDRTWAKQKKNPLTNHKAMVKLNPYAAVIRKNEMAAQAARAAKAAKGQFAKRARTSAKLRGASKAKLAAIQEDDFARPVAK